MSTEFVEIYTDGACKGNPGPGGWGALLRYKGQEKELWGGELDTTNIRMELLAVIQALNSLKRPCAIHLYTDSQYVQKGISEWIHGWKARGWKTAAKEPVQHQIDGRWVKGHAGHEFNERADALANRGVETALAGR